ncbi:unnamed protein product (macronuclear) [Paramecium tetraurelia]|uniref:DUF998 domain-containing protein n=1 Tax=Paramecium tetraurelia TaxID=5888 RepID=A0C756_PARTE|nr:uncharacterized protein GSPATT00035753001 [Paramecium tetraurelia]CAK66623.1 unnamed protein product [Paramecium tetraurelia]|eukprot:XP_001434020.1 hypothetical protein (macronuclear) [Paramecium tetraurelia strain d4-2]
MISEITRNLGLYKALFLVIGVVLIVFCFFFNVAELLSTGSGSYYLTFSGKTHSSINSMDCYMNIPDCNGDALCKTVKTTPYLGGFALGFAGLVLLFSLGESLISRVLKQFHIWLIQMISLFFCWALLLIIPILYLTAGSRIWDVSWLPLFFEFAALFSTTISAFLYYKSKEGKGLGILS